MKNGKDPGAGIERLYAAAMAPDEWPSAIAWLTHALGGETATLAAAHRDRPSSLLDISIGIDPRHLWHLRSPQALRIAAPLNSRIPEGRLVSATCLISEAEWARSAYYNELVRPTRTFYGVVLRREQHPVKLLFSLCRSRRGGDFDAADIARMQALLPHLSTAVELYNRLGIAESRCSGLAQALDRIETAVILVDARSRCVFVNAAAERLERENKGLHFGPNGITASTAVATAELRAAIASLVKSPTAEGACLSLALASQRSPLLLRLFSLQEIAANLVGTADPCVAIFVRERKVASAPDAATLAEAFGLTRRESEIAHLIALGVDLGEIADRLELGVGTVRNHLKRAFEKTGTHSQAAMVALIRGALAL